MPVPWEKERKKKKLCDGMCVYFLMGPAHRCKHGVIFQKKKKTVGGIPVRVGGIVSRISRWEKEMEMQMHTIPGSIPVSLILDGKKRPDYDLEVN